MEVMLSPHKMPENNISTCDLKMLIAFKPCIPNMFFEVLYVKWPKGIVWSDHQTKLKLFKHFQT